MSLMPDPPSFVAAFAVDLLTGDGANDGGSRILRERHYSQSSRSAGCRGVSERAGMNLKGDVRTETLLVLARSVYDIRSCLIHTICVTHGICSTQ